jgi:hypothetical protein
VVSVLKKSIHLQWFLIVSLLKTKTGNVQSMLEYRHTAHDFLFVCISAFAVLPVVPSSTDVNKLKTSEDCKQKEGKSILLRINKIVR